MSKVGSKLLYLLVALSFVSTAIVSSSVISEDGTQAFVSIVNYSQPISLKLYDTLGWISTAFTSGTLLVLINLLRLTNKDNAITQGTLDAKQNQTLTNDIVIMNAVSYLLENENIGNKVVNQNIRLELEDAMFKSKSLSQTMVDITAAPIATRIEMKQKYIETMRQQLEIALTTGDFPMKEQLMGVIKMAETEVATLMKKL